MYLIQFILVNSFKFGYSIFTLINFFDFLKALVGGIHTAFALFFSEERLK